MISFLPPTIILSPSLFILSLLPFILSLSKDRPPNHHHPKPLTLHPEPVEGLSRLGVARADQMDKTGPTLAYYVHLLRCSDGSYYVGHANDPEHRLAAHERGAIEGYTLSRRPVDLVFSDQFSTGQEAFHRERRIKGDWEGLVELSNRSSGQAILRQAQDEG